MRSPLSADAALSSGVCFFGGWTGVIGMIVCELIRRDQSDAQRVGTQAADRGERPANPTGRPGSRTQKT